MPDPSANMHCRNCMYSLCGLAENRCPECGLWFDPEDADSYRVVRPTVFEPNVVLPALIVFLLSFGIIWTLQAAAGGAAIGATFLGACFFTMIGLAYILQVRDDRIARKEGRTPPMRSSTPPPKMIYCKECQYQLDGLAENRCPECGSVFDPDDPYTYTQRPDFIKRWGITFAIITAIVLAIITAIMLALSQALNLLTW